MSGEKRKRSIQDAVEPSIKKPATSSDNVKVSVLPHSGEWAPVIGTSLLRDSLRG